MSAAKEVKFNLKVMLNKEKTKVICAELDSDLADVLLSFLTMPLGRIVSVLEKHYGSNAPVIGSLNTLRSSLANMDSVHFWSENGKLMLLDPRSSFEDECCKLKLNVYNAQPTKYFTCGDYMCKRKGLSHNVTIYYGTSNCDACGKSLNSQVWMSTGTSNGNGGVFTPKTMSFLLTDNLEMMPNVPGSISYAFTKLGIKDTDGVELRTATVGLNEVMDLLKWSLLSESPLTNLILGGKRQVASATTKYEPAQTERNQTLNPKKMIVKAMIQKSTNRLFLVQAKEDFVDFLFGLLTIPLGRVVHLLSSKTCLGSVDNLHTSLGNLTGDVYLKSLDTKSSLLEPKVPPGYKSVNLILPITQQNPPTVYYCPTLSTYTPEVHTDIKCYFTSFKDPKVEGSFVKRPGVFLVTDGLSVVPSSMTSTLSIVNKVNVPFSDVEELDIVIGQDEALSILKASLTSNCVLTNALYSILKKQPKLEH